MWECGYCSYIFPHRESSLLFHDLVNRITATLKIPCAAVENFFSHPIFDSLNSPAVKLNFAITFLPSFWTCFCSHQMHHDLFFLVKHCWKERLLLYPAVPWILYYIYCLKFHWNRIQPEDDNSLQLEECQDKAKTFIEVEYKFQAEIWLLLYQITSIICYQFTWWTLGAVERHHCMYYW